MTGQREREWEEAGMSKPHEHRDPSWWEYDARGIPLAKVCDECVDEVLRRYRPDVLSNPSYEADEPIEEDW